MIPKPESFPCCASDLQKGYRVAGLVTIEHVPCMLKALGLISQTLRVSDHCPIVAPHNNYPKSPQRELFTVESDICHFLGI